jgi:hypothetical protein
MSRIDHFLKTLEDSPVSRDLVLVRTSQSDEGLSFFLTFNYFDLYVDVIGDRSPAVALVGYEDISRGRRVRIDELVRAGLMDTTVPPERLIGYPDNDHAEAVTLTLLRDLLEFLPALRETLSEESLAEIIAGGTT